MNRIIVAGTGPVEPDGSTTPGGAAEQAARCCTIIVAAIEALGGSAVASGGHFHNGGAFVDFVEHGDFEHRGPGHGNGGMCSRIFRMGWSIDQR